MKTFTLNKEYTVICNSEGTRYGFRHLATLIKNGNEVCKAKCCYYNRTWECYTFQSVLHQIIEKYFDKRTAKRYKNKVDGVKKENPLKPVGMVMAIGDLLCNTQEEKNKWKERMAKTVSGINFPEDWDTLSEEEKQKRLNGVQSIALKENV